jgi:hypothetical protein
MWLPSKNGSGQPRKFMITFYILSNYTKGRRINVILAPNDKLSLSRQAGGTTFSHNCYCECPYTR